MTSLILYGIRYGNVLVLDLSFSVVGEDASLTDCGVFPLPVSRVEITLNYLSKRSRLFIFTIACYFFFNYNLYSDFKNSQLVGLERLTPAMLSKSNSYSSFTGDYIVPLRVDVNGE